MRNFLVIMLLLFLMGCMHSEPEQKAKPIMVVSMEEPQDWLIGRKIKFSQRDKAIFMSRPENPTHYLGYENPDKIAVKIGKSIGYIENTSKVTMPSDYLKILQEVDTNTEFTIIGSYTRRMSNWQERLWPLIDRMLIVQDPGGQQYVVYQEIVSRKNYPDMFLKERRAR